MKMSGTLNNSSVSLTEKWIARAHRRNLNIWLVALTLNLFAPAAVGLLSLNLEPAAYDPLRLIKTDQVVMVLVLGLLLLVMFLRRNFLQPARLITINSRPAGEAEKRGQSESGTDEDQWTGLIRQQFKYQLLIWILIDCIALTALLEFLAFHRFQTFITYYIVSLIALLVHIPRYSFLEILYIRWQNR